MGWIINKLVKKLGRQPTEAEVSELVAKDIEGRRRRRAERDADPEMRAAYLAQKKVDEAARKKRVMADPVRLERAKETARRSGKNKWARIKSDPDLHASYLKKHSEDSRESYAHRRATDPEFVENHRKRTRDYFNTEKGQKIRRETISRLRRESPAFRIASYIRTRISGAIRNGEKFGRSTELLGCPFDAYKSYLESLFDPGMSWDNYGNKEGCWSIDHKTPLAAHDLGKESGQKVAFHYTNTKPIWHNENLCKSSIYNGKRWYYRDHMPAPAPV